MEEPLEEKAENLFKFQKNRLLHCKRFVRFINFAHKLYKHLVQALFKQAFKKPFCFSNVQSLKFNAHF